MLNRKAYKIGFDYWGLILFLLLMVPNLVWFAIPAPSDVLRQESITPAIDLIASIFQVIMVTALSLLINEQRSERIHKGIGTAIILSIALYFMGWIAYYTGHASALIILDLSVAPCIAFILFSIARKNVLALLSASVFMLCHLIYAIVNFI